MLLVSVATVGLWCANGALADVLGEMGIIAVLPMVAFFGFGVLGKACPWHFSNARHVELSTVVLCMTVGERCLIPESCCMPAVPTYRCMCSSSQGFAS